MIPFHFYQEIDTRHITRGNEKQQNLNKGECNNVKENHIFTPWPNNITLRILILETLAKKQNKTNMYDAFHCSPICNSKSLKTIKYPSRDWLAKLWYNHVMKPISMYCSRVILRMCC